MIILNSPQNGKKISLLTDEQRKFLEMNRAELCMENFADFDYINLKKADNIDCSFPQQVRFEWDAKGESEIQISENEKFDICYSKKSKNSCQFTNFKCGKRYFWRVICKNEISDTYFFETEDVFPRVIKIDGITNVRDCGGWKTTDKKRIRQGLLYRGSEMNSHINITDEGLKTMKEILNIKSVLDLRGKTELVDDIYEGKYVNIPVTAYSDFIENCDVARKIFEFLFDEENYPVYFHCWGGADRTGTVAFLAGAVLGMNYEDLMDDYEFTSLSVWGTRSRNSEEYFKKFYKVFNSFDGDTIKKKAENYFLSCGISKTLIKNFRDFMTY